MFKRIAVLGIVILLFVIGALYVAADGPNPGTTFVSPLPGACPGLEPSDTVTNALTIRATQIITDSISPTDASDFYRLEPRCPTPVHYRTLIIRPLIPGFVPKKRTWLGSVGPNGTYWGSWDWDYPNDMAACAADWTKCTITSQVGCPPASYYTNIHIEVAQGGASQDVAECRMYSVEWRDPWTKSYLPLVVR